MSISESSSNTNQGSSLNVTWGDVINTARDSIPPGSNLNIMLGDVISMVRSDLPQLASFLSTAGPLQTPPNPVDSLVITRMRSLRPGGFQPPEDSLSVNLPALPPGQTSAPHDEIVLDDSSDDQETAKKTEGEGEDGGDGERGARL